MRRLSHMCHINALHINQSHQPKNQSMKFSQSFFRIGHLEKLGFWVGHFERSIIQTFWRPHCWTKFLVFELILQMLATCLFFYFVWLIAKFWKDWTTFILDILQGSPLWIFGKLQKTKKHQRGTLLKCVI